MAGTRKAVRVQVRVTEIEDYVHPWVETGEEWSYCHILDPFSLAPEVREEARKLLADTIGFALADALEVQWKP